MENPPYFQLHPVVNAVGHIRVFPFPSDKKADSCFGSYSMTENSPHPCSLFTSMKRSREKKTCNICTWPTNKGHC